MQKFPVNVHVGVDPEPVFRNARVHYDRGRTSIYVWDDSIRTGRLMLAGPGEPIKSSFRQWSFEADDGVQYRLADSGSCGCGHPMKRWKPAASALQHTKAPG